MKFSILLSILFDLLSKRKLTATYLAEKHDLSPRTVYRYVEILSSCVPVYVKRGRNGGIYISDCYKLPLNFMTETEYGAAIEALSIAYSVRPEDYFLEAKRKLSTQRKSELNVETLFGEIGNVIIDGENFYNAPRLLEKLRFWEECIKKRTLVEINAFVDGAKMQTNVEPHAIVFTKGAWNVYAFCHTLRTFRLFPIGQILAVAKTQSTFRARPFQRNNVIPTPIEAPALLPVRLEISPIVLTAVQNWLGAENVRKQKGKWVVEISLLDDENLPRKILGFGKGVKVLSPASLQQRICALAEEIQALYN